MHLTSLKNCKAFFDSYASYFGGQKAKIVEIGSQDINGSLRSIAPPQFEYIGVDFAAGKGVDVILDDPYTLPFGDNFADIVLCSSCFEHSEMFWLVFLEIMRILKPHGLFYLNVPSNGHFHRYPVDCWRFYPDSGRALVTWAKRNGINATMLESYTSMQEGTIPHEGPFWNDFVAVFAKDAQHIDRFPRRILDSKRDINNGMMHGSDTLVNATKIPEDLRKLDTISRITSNQIKIS